MIMTLKIILNLVVRVPLVHYLDQLDINYFVVIQKNDSWDIIIFNIWHINTVQNQSLLNNYPYHYIYPVCTHIDKLALPN